MWISEGEGFVGGGGVGKEQKLFIWAEVAVWVGEYLEWADKAAKKKWFVWLGVLRRGI